MHLLQRVSPDGRTEDRVSVPGGVRYKVRCALLVLFCFFPHRNVVRISEIVIANGYQYSVSVFMPSERNEILIFVTFLPTHLK